jgi:valyl-tRNA synthetase
MRKSLILVSLLALYALSGLAHAGKVYKWVDKDGNVHYTNTPPPEAAQQDRTVLDEHGNVTETLRGVKTPEEIEAERQRQAEIASQEKLAQERAARDNMLLQTYTAVEDMEMARDGRVNALEAQVKVVSGAISSLETQLAGLESRAATLREGGKPVPEAMQKEIDATRTELLDNQKFLIARKEEQDGVRERFAADIARFKELRGLK